jgi:hypothetical protein
MTLITAHGRCNVEQHRGSAGEPDSLEGKTLMADEKQDQATEAEKVDPAPVTPDGLQDIEPLEDQSDDVKGGGIPRTPSR